MKPCPSFLVLWVTFVAAIGGGGAAQVEGPRSDKHQKYAKTLWDYVQQKSYEQWQVAKNPISFPFGPPVQRGKHFLNSEAASGMTRDGSVVVTEHYAADATTLGVTVWRKMPEGYSSSTDDWYWAHYTPDGLVVNTSADKNAWSKRGFVVFEEDGRLWVFETHSPELQNFLKDGELAKHAIRPGAGPMGMTIKAPDAQTIDLYLFSKPGFELLPLDGRLWIFKSGSQELAAFQRDGELAKHVVRPGAGPTGITLKAPDHETIVDYLVAAEGFTTIASDDGRLWVFRHGAPELDDFKKAGELAKHVIRPGAGPDGMTLKAPDLETLAAYLHAIQR